MVALPALIRSTRDLLVAEPKQTLRLFASLKHHDKLGEVDIVWRSTIDNWLCERLSGWELNPDRVDELHSLLSLSAYVEKMPVLLVGRCTQPRGFMEHIPCKRSLGFVDMYAYSCRIEERVMERSGRFGGVD